MSRLDSDVFVQDGYNSRAPFSGFLPGVAGINGSPLWCLYVNRGQCVASFGADERDGAMMEYSPAAIAYEDTARKGFRSFVSAEGLAFEPFSPHDPEQEQELRVGRAFIALSAYHRPSGLAFEVDYRGLPGEGTGALMRTLRVKNRSGRALRLRLADGMARVIPGGIRNSEFREMANLTKSYFDARLSGRGFALFTARSTTENSARVGVSKRSHFYFAAREGAPLPICLDAREIFGEDSSLTYPGRFYSKAPVSVPESVSDLIPCAFSLSEFALGPGEETAIRSFAGFLDGEGGEERYAPRFLDEAWCEARLAEAVAVVEELAGALGTQTAEPRFDGYIRQSMLDNILRGGMPRSLAGRTLHLYSRRHGDLERDYNYFRLEAAHFSEGDGNFRDICQNRRSDVVFWPETGAGEIIDFLSLIQLDGYCPLELLPDALRLPPERLPEARALLSGRGEEALEALSGGVSAGGLWRLLRGFGDRADALTGALAALCESERRCEFVDGYWIDHWTYVPDLIDSFLAVFPERRRELLFSTPVGSEPVRARIRPLAGRVRQTPAGLRQYDAAEPCEPLGRGPEMSVFSKLLLLAALKCATLDHRQTGIEMEAGKPGWNDALNGLPGLFGSSASECVDLRLLLERLAGWLEGDAELFASAAEFIRDLAGAAKRAELCREPSAEFYRESLRLREGWRERLYAGGLDFSPAVLPEGEARECISALLGLVRHGLERARRPDGLLDTYFINEARLEGGETVFCAQRPLPLFLEGQAKLLRLADTDAAALCRAVDAGELFDGKLRMYRLCGSLEGESAELGRIRAFTPGVFERESVFLHAELKYLLAMFDAGLYAAAFERLYEALPAFFDPDVYGRSPLENSSYIVSSVHPDASLHGRGFMARLSGATAETLSLWLRVFPGRELFSADGEGLRFTLAPRLPGRLFRGDGTLSFAFLGCRFTYINPSRRDSFGPDGVRPRRLRADGLEIEGAALPPELAGRLREGRLKEIYAELA